MTAVVPARPVEGARLVAFDYAAAARALGSLGAAAAAVGDHGAAQRRSAADAVVGWEGAHRDEFDRARGVLDDCTVAALEALHAARRAVLAAVDEANAQQVAYNVAHERAAVGAARPAAT